MLGPATLLSHFSVWNKAAGALPAGVTGSAVAKLLN